MEIFSMSLYQIYLKEIEERKAEGLKAKPIDDGPLTEQIVSIIKDEKSQDRPEALKFFIYNILPGTTSAAHAKAMFLKEIILGTEKVAEIKPAFAFELLSHMKGGPSVEVLLDLALGDDASIAKEACEVLKTQVFLYDDDTKRLGDAFNSGSKIAKELLESYARAEFFTKLPAVEETIEVVSYVAGEGDATIAGLRVHVGGKARVTLREGLPQVEILELSLPVPGPIRNAIEQEIQRQLRRADLLPVRFLTAEWHDGYVLVKGIIK